MRLYAVAALLVGIALAVFLVLHVGITPVLTAVAKVGWSGFVLILLAHLVVVSLLGTGWYALASGRISWPATVLARQMRDSGGDLLPVTQFGGMVIGARAAILGGLSPPFAFASTVVDVTTEFMAQIAFIVLGLLFGLAHLRADPVMAPYVNSLIFGTVMLIPSVMGFMLLQRRGSSLAVRLAAMLLPAAVRHTNAFTEMLDEIYRHPLRLALSSTAHLLAWIASGVWIWFILRLIGVHIDVFSAVTIESLIGALRSATVFVPSGIGVQEAGYAALAHVFGLGPEIGLAVSLLRRARDVAVGVPMLLIWQAVEGRRAFAMHNGNGS
jgi:putative membrane protein